MKRVLVDLAEDHVDYFAACARIRDVSRTGLLETILTTIAKDDLVLSILDDDSKPQPRAKFKRRWVAPKPRDI